MVRKHLRRHEGSRPLGKPGATGKQTKYADALKIHVAKISCNGPLGHAGLDTPDLTPSPDGSAGSGSPATTRRCYPIVKCFAISRCGYAPVSLLRKTSLPRNPS